MAARGDKNEMFEITDAGYQLAERLDARARELDTEYPMSKRSPDGA